MDIKESTNTPVPAEAVMSRTGVSDGGSWSDSAAENVHVFKLWKMQKN